MPVAHYDMPAESAVFLVNRVDAHHVFHRAVYLKGILVHYSDQVVKLVVRGLHCRFPNLPFLLLAVAHYAVYPVAFPVKLGCQGVADRY